MLVSLHLSYEGLTRAHFLHYYIIGDIPERLWYKRTALFAAK